MDDYLLDSLNGSKSGWCAQLVDIFTPAVISGLKSIFDEAFTLCIDNDEEDKYLMTFQTFLCRIPKWNNQIIDIEYKRISKLSSCSSLEELITCVHILQLKSLSCIRVGQQQKKINIDIPSVTTFIHSVYINVARKVYTNVYLFEKNIHPLQIQKHNRELEIIIKECIMCTIRETMPIEELLKAYLSETTEEEVCVTEEILERPDPIVSDPIVSDPIVSDPIVSEPIVSDPIVSDPIVSDPIVSEPIVSEPIVPVPTKASSEVNIGDSLRFTDEDKAIDTTGVESTIVAPKDFERLDKIAIDANNSRKAAELGDSDEETEGGDDRLALGEQVAFDVTDINDLTRDLSIKPLQLLDIETLK